MGSSVALLVCGVGIAGLFFLDRDQSVRTSKFLWLPVIWIWIVASRPISEWFGLNPSTPSAQQLLDGSPTDRLVFGILLAFGLVGLIGRRKRLSLVLRANWPIVAFFAFCLISTTWSD